MFPRSKTLIKNFIRRLNQLPILTGTRQSKAEFVLEKVESPGSQRTAVIRVSRGVTLLVCGFGQLVYVMPQTSVSFTEIQNEKTKWMDLLLEKVESPGSQRTAVILDSRGVTLADTLLKHVLDHLLITPPLHPELFHSPK